MIVHPRHLALAAFLLGCSCPPISGVRGRVVDQDGVGLANARLESALKTETTTDAEGRFEIPELPGKASGEQCVSQHVTVGHASCGEKQIDKPSGEVLIELTCNPRADVFRITGQVVDSATSAPRAGVKLSLEPSADDPGLKAIVGTSGADGRFVVEYTGPSPAPRIVGAGRAWYDRDLIVTAAGCTSTTVRLVAFPNYTTGVVDVGVVKLVCP